MKIPVSIASIMQLLKDHGYAAYLVGGCVRDALLGLTPHDYDITTDATPEEVKAVFGEGHCTFYGRAFGTVGVKWMNGFAEVTTFRTEGNYVDSRHPSEVWFSKDIMEDLSRRDFTCNAIAYDPEEGILDPFGGREDLKKGILRAVGVPTKRFREDALRILRGMRFYARFGLAPEPLTDAAMRAEAFHLEAISAERIFTELCGMLMGAHITEVLLQYGEILAVRIPELTPCFGFEQHSRYHDFTVWEHIARAVGNSVENRTVRLTMLLHDIGKPHCYSIDARGGHFRNHAQIGAAMADEILRRLRCDNALRESVVRLIDWHRFTPTTMPAVRKMTGMMGEEEFRLFLAVLDADRVSKRLEGGDSRDAIDHAEALLEDCLRKKLPCTIKALAVNGRDLSALGFKGKQIGIALQLLLEAVIEDEVENTRDALLTLVKSWEPSDFPQTL